MDDAVEKWNPIILNENLPVNRELEVTKLRSFLKRNGLITILPKTPQML